jgi:hypothetical protein
VKLTPDIFNKLHRWGLVSTDILCQHDPNRKQRLVNMLLTLYGRVDE